MSRSRDQACRCLAAWAMIVSLVLATACGGRTALDEDRGDSSSGGPPDACQRVLGEEVFAHACIHSERGPYVDVDAVVTKTALPPDVSAIHTTYRVRLPHDVSNGGSRVAYRPARDGEHVLFIGPDVDVRVRDPEQDRILPTHHEAVGARCTALRQATVYELRQGGGYWIEIAAAAPIDRVTMFTEHLHTFPHRERWSSDCER